MKDVSFYRNQHWDVIIIGGGSTGVSTLQDLSMHELKTLLLDQQYLAYGTTSRFHGLLHSGARYVMKDQNFATDCIKENIILSKICKPYIENIGGLFIKISELMKMNLNLKKTELQFVTSVKSNHTYLHH